MSKRTSEQFWRLVLGGFGRRGGDGCVGDEELAIFAAGEPMEGGTRRRVARHVARCPACLEQTLVLRRLSGATHPLFHRTGADVWSAAWRPAATVAAALVLAGLLYLGGVGLQQNRGDALVPAVPMTEQAQPRPAEPREAVSAVPDREGEMAAAKSEPVRRAKDRPAAAPPAEPLADQAVFAPEAVMLEAQPVSSATAGRERKASDEKQAAADDQQRTADNEVRQRVDYSNIDSAKSVQAAPAAPAPAAGGAAVGAQRLALKEEAMAKGREADDWSARLANLCRSRREDAPQIVWQGRRFLRVDDVLIEEGVCARLGRWPVRPATPAEKAQLREAAGYDPAWRGVWLLGENEITGW
ncbi:MAG TPA: hypothetical protein PLU41_09265 [Acidobacteriota bacterium]|nr:hypothetical protein [Acidobacteriota bacterium]HQP74202.1 hypothetical protein [Acidobacteriota bacterium]